jgi:fatty-acyl-CoA synthase
VGEITKKADANNLRFGGYFDDAGATNKKFRDGIYHSGDLGHVRIINGKRYLYFSGRTDDWIRKDGENFSAENVMAYALKLPGVKLAAAYGAPSPVSDEQVMITVELSENAVFDPQQVFDWFMGQQKNGGMDPKWMPDYIRIIDAFTMTSTQKILVRPFKKGHFNIMQNPDMRIYFRDRGDTTYRKLTAEAFTDIQARFVETGRQGLL